ncbi:MAG TPA: NAD(P)H-dependent oxidoreductase [Candidatus Limnocylindrales bacterium]|jgi:FMN-dependent NADH-azoreductase|nr:NAD(P)H-dependent oxidoreductase [Candidatus Limnocylindrales bacterium]
MNTLLIVNSSPRSNSTSRRLTRQFSEDWKTRNPSGRIVERDLSDGTIPYLSEPWIEAAYVPEPERTPAQRDLLSLSDTLIDELLAADVILLGIPMHNFSVPASFKAWIDQIARAGKTFSYTSQGPKGLIPSHKKVVAVLSRGGIYAPDSPQGAMDFQVSYLRQVLALVGLTDVTFVHADRQAMGGQAAQLATERAIQQVSSVVDSFATKLVA